MNFADIQRGFIRPDNLNSASYADQSKQCYAESWMKTSKQDLAWRMYPKPNGTVYTVEDLKNPKTVEIIFDYCQILEATIFAKGWQLLFKTHGTDGLIEINRRSGWFEEDDDVEAKQDLFYHSRIAGYEPEKDIFGTYDEETGVFTQEKETASRCR
jgi:hypothetical protein